MLQHDQESARNPLLTLNHISDPKRYSLSLQLITIVINFVEFDKEFNSVPILIGTPQSVPLYGFYYRIDP
jgi:hypothetical protein